jgi:hypothetical protein
MVNSQLTFCLIFLYLLSIYCIGNSGVTRCGREMFHLVCVAFWRSHVSRRSPINSASHTHSGVVLRPSCEPGYARLIECRTRKPTLLRQLPKNLAAPAKAIGRWFLNLDRGVDDGSRCCWAAGKGTPYTRHLGLRCLVARKQ